MFQVGQVGPGRGNGSCRVAASQDSPGWPVRRPAPQTGQLKVTAAPGAESGPGSGGPGAPAAGPKFQVAAARPDQSPIPVPRHPATKTIGKKKKLECRSAGNSRLGPHRQLGSGTVRPEPIRAGRRQAPGPRLTASGAGWVSRLWPDRTPPAAAPPPLAGHWHDELRLSGIPGPRWRGYRGPGPDT
jgi:hypothetical protein